MLPILCFYIQLSLKGHFNLFSRMIECWYDKNQFISSLKQLFVHVYIVTQVIQSVPCIRDMCIFKVLTDLYGSPKEMMCFKSYCSIKLTFCHTACKINIIIVFMTLNASKYKVLITIWNVHVQKNFHNTFFF